MTRYYLRILDGTQELAKIPIDTTVMDSAAQGKTFNVQMQQTGYRDQYVGTWVNKGTPENVPTPPTPTCPPGQHWDAAQGKCVPDTTTPPEPPTPPTGDVLYDSLIHSKLHDGQIRSVTQEGNINAGGLGCECRASGDPKIRVNADKTFSLVTGTGHGRIYLYCLNYNATLELQCAFWNKVSGQDLSLKMRSRHNEGGDCENRFGGYGWAADNGSSKWDAKRETCHNEHDQVSGGSLPEALPTQKYFKIEFTVKDEGTGVRQIVKYNGQQVMSKLDSSPKPYMRDQASFAKQSYLWIRENVSSGTGEIRIKQVRVLKA